MDLVAFNLYNDIKVEKKGISVMLTILRNATESHRVTAKPKDSMEDKERDRHHAGADDLQLALTSTAKGALHYYLEYKMPP